MAVDESLAVRVLNEVSPRMSPTITTKPSPADVIRDARERGIKIVDLRFTDLIGSWQHFSIPVGEMTEGLFEDGIGFDGSSIRGFQKINESDMLLFPDPGRHVRRRDLEVPTLAIICDIKDPMTLEPYSRDPRYVAQKAEEYLLSTGIADTSFWGPEGEFYIFNSVRYDQNATRATTTSIPRRGSGTPGRTARRTSGSGRATRRATSRRRRSTSCRTCAARSCSRSSTRASPIEVHHHEVGTAGQTEIDMRFDTLVTMADKVMMYKHIVKNVCYQNGYTATFMPKPLFGDNGSGMHTHQSLWKDGVPLFYDKDGYALLSDTARWYIGGLLKHAPAILAFAAPTTNSYRRLVPGYEAPIKLAYSARNRSACIRIPTYSPAPAARRLEFRSPDPMCNPYLSFAACLMAGLDGVKRRIEPPKPVEADLYELEGEEKAMVKDLPGSLTEVLDALEADHDFLTEGGVFTPDLIDMYISYKREREVDPVALRPHPYEFHLYYDG